MSATKYTYSISQDFPNQKVAPSRLSVEIQESAIVIALDHIDTDGDSCNIWFKDDLSVGDESILSTIVSNHSGEPLPEPATDVVITSVEGNIPSTLNGFHDLSGHNVYRFGDLLYDVEAGVHNIYMEKFSTLMYLEGGGIRLPDHVFVDGTRVDYKPEKGDYVTFDLVDVENVLGYGHYVTDVSHVSRSSNVATVTTATPHGFSAGHVVCVDIETDDTYTDFEEAIIDVPSTTTFTYANAGDDEAEKSATGDVGIVVVIAPFVPQDYVTPGEEWECIKGDAKAIPPHVYMRFRYVSTGTTDLVVTPFYSLRT
jgi:hypothetical protein